MRTRSLALCAAGLLLAAGLGHAAAKTMSVQVRRGEVRAAASFLAAVVGALDYGAVVTVLEERAPWLRVEGPGGTPAGWIHASALTEKRIVLSAGGRAAGTGASRGELALAGKGFNAQVEGEFRRAHASADFATVDRMEKLDVPEREVREFLEAGGVRPATGGGS